MSESKETSDRHEYNWPQVLFQLYFHAFGLYGLVLCFVSAKLTTILFAVFLICLGTIALTVGAHRFYAHRTFETNCVTRFILVFIHTIAGAGSIYDWVLAHRMHHKFYGTDKDPYNHNKGFVYSHFLSQIVKQPEFDKTRREIDMRDIETDGFVWLQKKLYWLLFGIVALLLPINFAVEYWDESLVNSICIVGFLRIGIMCNIAALINSSMLVWGLKPDDKLMPIVNTISLLYKLFFKMPKSHGTVVIDSHGLRTMYPADDNSIFFVYKSYWLNYHYQLPWDWKSGEFGTYDSGYATLVIKICRELGLLSGMRTVSNEAVREALYKVATKQLSMADATKELENISNHEAIIDNLRVQH